MNQIIVTSEDLFNVQQAAKKLGITRMTIYRWMKAGKIIAIRLGDMPFIPKSEIERLLHCGVGGDAVDVAETEANRAECHD